MYDILELNKKLVSELRQIAKDLNVKKADSLRKQDLVYKILDQQAINATEETEPVKKERRNPAKSSVNDDTKKSKASTARDTKNKEDNISEDVSSKTKNEERSRRSKREPRAKDNKRAETQQSNEKSAEANG